ncbi:unnamed protein product [Didymodactylos carnosus]|uniref:Uncharacterized protein n=1 Tax=Didymodactylos carnosus TaxID=1234261 RepID=A0A813YY36_9BILA|nr:unnamed protein product [Didymodactylos carnosus]CAF0890402.1 unnamed protein product [Didymodactylos carnosus]CAF3573801.1 unnamed protein product [Didymodactylos carnosus]CAF3674815.1 unnamed protein product [Didymodactylos carnosus]
MARFQPILPLTNILPGSRRYRSHTTQLILLIIFIFLCLTVIAFYYLPDATRVDFVDIIKRHKDDFEAVFVPPIPKPPLHWGPNRLENEHNHSVHLYEEQAKLKEKIERAKADDTLVAPDLKPKTSTLSPESKDGIDRIKFNLTDDIGNSDQPLSIQNLTQLFGNMSIEQLQQIKSPRIRREKVRERKLTSLRITQYMDSL